MSDDYTEKRKSARLKGAFTIKIADGTSEMHVRGIDLSEAGVSFLSDQELPMFREVDLTLQLPFQEESKDFHINAIVVRSDKSHISEEGYHTALVYTKVSEGDRETLQQFLDSGFGDSSQASS